MDKTSGNGLRLLVTSSDAARALAISTRKLWAMTKEGEMPCVRIGRAVRYEVDSRKEACL